MALAETARLVASLDLKDNFTATAKKIEGSLGHLEGQVGKLGKAAASSRAVAVGLGVGLERLAEKGISTLGDAIGSGIDELNRLQTAQAQTAAVISSTGGKAGVSAEQVRKYAEALEDTTTADDKAIQSAENLLLTFTGIGEKTFPGATKAVVDLGIAMAQGDVANADFKSSAIQIGKALNDPVKGITALTRVGVSFTDQQKDQIKAMVEAGDVAGAQAVILKELETEFGEAGKAAGTGFPADARRFQDAVADAEASLASGLLPALQSVTKWLTTKLKDPSTIRFMEDLGKNLGKALDAAVSFAQKIPWSAIGDSLRIAGQGAKALFDAFTSLPPWVQTAVITGWGLNKISGGALTNLLGGLTKDLVGGVVDFFKGRGSTPANPLFVEDATGSKGIVDAVGKGALGVSASIVALGALIAALPFFAAGDTPQSGNPDVAPVGDEQTRIRISDIERDIERLKRMDAAAPAFPGSTTNTQTVAQRIADLTQQLKALQTGQPAAIADAFKQATSPMEAHLGKIADDQARAVTGIGKLTDDTVSGMRTLAIGLNVLDRDFVRQRDILRKSTDPKAIALAAAAITKDILGGAGSSKNTADVLATLRAQRGAAAKAGDTQLVKLLDADIAKITPKLENRLFVDKQLAKLAAIQADGRITADETKTLRGIQADLRAHGDTQAAGIIETAIAASTKTTTAAIDAAKADADGHSGKLADDVAGLAAAISAGTTSAETHAGKIADDVARSRDATVAAVNATTQAIKDKDLSVEVTFGGKALDDLIRPIAPAPLSSDRTTELSGKSIDDLVKRFPTTWLFKPDVKLDPSQIRDLRTAPVTTAIARFDDRDNARTWKQLQALHVVQRSVDVDRRATVAALSASASRTAHAVDAVRSSVDRDRAASVAAANAAAAASRATTEAVKDKDLSFTANLTTNIVIPVSLYSINKAQKLKSRLTGRIGGP